MKIISTVILLLFGVTFVTSLDIKLGSREDNDISLYTGLFYSTVTDLPQSHIATHSWKGEDGERFTAAIITVPDTVRIILL